MSEDLAHLARRCDTIEHQFHRLRVEWKKIMPEIQQAIARCDAVMEMAQEIKKELACSTAKKPGGKS